MIALRGALAGLFVLLCMAWPARVGAQGQPTHELALIGPLPEGAEARIAGQTADLPFRLARVSPQRPGSVEDAAAIAGERGARAALWIEERAGAFTLHLLDARTERVLERRFAFDPGARALSRSAALEALALAVRSALNALAANADLEAAEPSETGPGGPSHGGGTTGTSGGAGSGGSGTAGTNGGGATGTTGAQRPRTDEPEPARTAREPRAREAEREPPAPRAPEDRRPAEPDDDVDVDESDSDPTPAPSAYARALRTGSPALALAGGWTLAGDGHSPSGQQGPWLRAGLVFAPFELGIAVQTALPADLQIAQAAVELRRSAALAYLSLDALHTSRVRLAIAASVGAVQFRRHTRDVAPGLTPTGDAQPLALGAGLELRAAFALFELARARLELELSAGALAVPAAPVLRYELAGARYERKLWAVEPELRLGPHLRLLL